MASRALCRQALTRYENDLSRKRNVVGLGIVPCRSGVRFLREKEFAVAVYVSHKRSVQDLPDGDVIPNVLQVTHKGSAVDVPVRVIEHGPIILEHKTEGSLTEDRSQ
jgi:hypothetical protein